MCYYGARSEQEGHFAQDGTEFWLASFLAVEIQAVKSITYNHGKILTNNVELADPKHLFIPHH